MTEQCVLIACFAFLLFATSLESEGYRDRGSWKQTLHEKSAYFEENIKERHNIEGTYPSSVRLIPPKHYAGSQEGAWKQIIETGKLPPGWIFDHGTTGLSNVAHTSSWTGCYLTAEAFRVAFLRKEFGEDSAEFRDAYERANEVISGIRKLTRGPHVLTVTAKGAMTRYPLSWVEMDQRLATAIPVIVTVPFVI
jgi:hypothetical protein